LPLIHNAKKSILIRRRGEHEFHVQSSRPASDGDLKSCLSCRWETISYSAHVIKNLPINLLFIDRRCYWILHDPITFLLFWSNQRSKKCLQRSRQICMINNLTDSRLKYLSSGSPLACPIIHFVLALVR